MRPATCRPHEAQAWVNRFADNFHKARAEQRKPMELLEWR